MSEFPNKRVMNLTERFDTPSMPPMSEYNANTMQPGQKSTYQEHEFFGG